MILLAIGLGAPRITHYIHIKYFFSFGIQAEGAGNVNMLEQRKKLKKLFQKSANGAINNLQFVFALWQTKTQRLVSLLASTQMYCLILRYSLEGWRYLVASKRQREIFYCAP